MKTQLLLIAILFFAKIFNANAQSSQEWARIYNGSGNGNDQAAAIVQDASGNIIVTGRAVSTGNNNDFCTIKYSSAGIQQWAVTYNGPGNGYDEAVGLATDNSGNIYVAGYTLNSISNYDIALVKYNSDGIQQWVKILSGSGNLDDVPYAINCDNSGNILVTGNTQITGLNSNYITLKYNAAGDLLWERQYNNPIDRSDIPHYIKTDQAGNVYVTGTSIAQNTGSDFLTIKYNSNGDSLWTARYSGTTEINEIPQGLAVDQSGNVYVTGFSRGASNSTDFATIKYNPDGIRQWVAIYDTTGQQDIPEDIEVDGDGNVYVTGRSRVSNSYNDIATIKYNTNGVRQWIAIYDNKPESRDDQGTDLILDGQGNVYVTGYSQESGTNNDVVTLKYNSSGEQQWLARYDVTNSEEAYAIILDNANNVYVTGYQSSGGSDFLTIKYSQSVGIQQSSIERPADFRLNQNYPNPFNPVTNLGFVISKNGPPHRIVSLKVYDIQGEEVATLVNEDLPAGEYRYVFDGANLSSGVYYYILEAGKFSETKSMLLLK
ncbi:MAG: SBBP repeat-containing protein [Ignavibacteriae bacterium]|nr:SBBP repeat-containing protein [Ignavibacteriota bacterium]